MGNVKTDCVFYDVYHDHGASIPTCCFDLKYDLSADIARLNRECPCKFYTTLLDVRESLLDHQ